MPVAAGGVERSGVRSMEKKYAGERRAIPSFRMLGIHAVDARFTSELTMLLLACQTLTRARVA